MKYNPIGFLYQYVPYSLNQMDCRSGYLFFLKPKGILWHIMFHNCGLEMDVNANLKANVGFFLQD
jgi:hypothetical protein